MAETIEISKDMIKVIEHGLRMVHDRVNGHYHNIASQVHKSQENADMIEYYRNAMVQAADFQKALQQLKDTGEITLIVEK